MEEFSSEYEDMELSTQIVIHEAIRRGVAVDILDRSDNFLSLSRDGRTEYVKQATRTSVDNYIAPLVMENKQVTKVLLQQKGFNVPEGVLHTNAKSATEDFGKFMGQDIVIKPKSTNFGVGISIIKSLDSVSEFRTAIELAFSFGDSILIEKFIEGKEYRFLVIDDQVQGVLHRVAANVLGDGKRSILELVEEKNRNPLRGVGYNKPLEQIRLGSIEKLYLANQELTIESVPAEGQRIFLRENSNISTGGDSIDYTDEMAEVYKDLASRSVKAVGARICGADIIISGSINDPDPATIDETYSIIELNFNPAIHIHGYPHKGKNRHAEKNILDLLGFPENTHA